MRRAGLVILSGAALAIAAPAGQAVAANPLYWGTTGRIAFISSRNACCDVYSIRPDGGGVKQLTSSPGSEDGPVWSPDGKWIAYSRYSPNPSPHSSIFKMRADGTDRTRLTRGSTAFDYTPAWSPGGHRIAYSHRPNNTSDGEIFSVSASGGHPERLTANSVDDHFPSWSPDGKRIVFASNRRGGDSEIVVMRADGSHQHRLTKNNFNDSAPAWSPSGRLIAFETTPGSTSEIATMRPDGSHVHLLTSDTTNDYEPAWSPNGGHLTYVDTSSTYDEIYTINSNGMNPFNVTQDPAFNDYFVD